MWRMQDLKASKNFWISSFCVVAIAAIIFGQWFFIQNSKDIVEPQPVEVISETHGVVMQPEKPIQITVSASPEPSKSLEDTGVGVDPPEVDSGSEKGSYGRIDEQRRIIDEQNQRVDNLNREIDDLEAKVREHIRNRDSVE